MPELPEVETIKRGLELLIIGKSVSEVTHDTPKSFPNAPADVEESVVSSQITGIRRRAKVLLIDLSSEYTLVIHLKMTGQLVYVADNARFGAGHPNDSLVSQLPDKSTRVTFKFNDASQLYFNDQRKFGWVKLYPTIEVPNIDFMKRVGPEPLEAEFTGKDFIKRIRRRDRTTVKAAILDQTTLAGVGNIYADESLWAAKIHPDTRVAAVSDAKLKTLLAEIRNALNQGIEKGGSTDRNYLNAEGKKGSYLGFAKVFRREGKPCFRCGNEIIKIRVVGRGTHICTTCQKIRVIK